MGADWVDTSELIAAARRHGEDVSTRSLELWRYRGLLPRGRRQTHGRAAWSYPPETETQLLRLLHWRKRSRSHDLVRIALWVEGFDIDLDEVRASIASVAHLFWRGMMRDVDPDDPSEALDSLARTLATKRGKAGIPRIVRMSTEDRTRACALALAYLLNLQEEIDRRKADLVLLQRMLGLRSGHGGGLAVALELDQETTLIPPLPSPRDVEAILSGAPEEELELARRFARMIVVWIPLAMPMLAESHGDKARPMVELGARLFADLPPQFHAFAVTASLVALHARGHEVTALRDQLAEFTPGAVNVELLGMLPARGRKATFDQLPPLDQKEVATELRIRRRAKRPVSAGSGPTTSTAARSSGRGSRP